jgi:integrase/recombinase XerD
MPKPPNLLRKVKIDDKWKMLPVVRNKISGGEQRFDLTRVMHAGVPVVVTAGTFYLEYRENGRKRRAIGDHPTEVKAALATQASVLGLRALGVAADDAPQLRPRSTVRPEGKTVRAVVDAFVTDPPSEYRHKSYLKYRNALESFAAWSTRKYCVEVERDDIKAFVSAQVRQQGLDVSTAKDKAVAVAKILRDQGAPIVMRKGDWPKVTRRQREIYRPEILKKLFAAADEEEYVLFQTFLLTGMREQEVSYLYWTDFEANEGTLSVSKKPGFDPKNYEERTIPIFDELVEQLEAHRRRQDGKQLYLFPTSLHNVKRGAPGGQADGHMLRRLKRLAFRAGLNCGRCVGKLNKKPASCATAPICQEFGLHKFRHTYATQMLQDGVDLVSLQKLLGHKDLDSTREYLRALEPNDLRKKILTTSLAKRFV